MTTNAEALSRRQRYLTAVRGALAAREASVARDLGRSSSQIYLILRGDYPWQGAHQWPRYFEAWASSCLRVSPDDERTWEPGGWYRPGPRPGAREFIQAVAAAMRSAGISRASAARGLRVSGKTMAAILQGDHPKPGRWDWPAGFGEWGRGLLEGGDDGPGPEDLS